eukprot:42208-Amphidinium_carterae.1
MFLNLLYLVGGRARGGRLLGGRLFLSEKHPKKTEALPSQCKGHVALSVQVPDSLEDSRRREEQCDLGCPRVQK